jgi:predicted small integral membrane protein
MIDFLKKAYSVARSWIFQNGISGILGLIAGLLLWVFGYKVYAGFAFGVFFTRNWDIIFQWFLPKEK